MERLAVLDIVPTGEAWGRADAGTVEAMCEEAAEQLLAFFAGG